MVPEMLVDSREGWRGGGRINGFGRRHRLPNSKQITRYNMFPAAPITGASLPDVSTGDVLATMERLADQQLSKNMSYEWTELSYLQKQASKVEQFRDLQNNPLSAFVLGAVLVFFVLAGLYE